MSHPTRAIAVVVTPAEQRARERASLREAVCDVVANAALTYDELAAAVREDWGACSDVMLDGVLRELWRAGRVEGVRIDGGKLYPVTPD